MKKNNEELKHKKEKEIKLTKKNYIIIIVPIILIILLIAFIAIYVFIISSQEHKLKSLLLDMNYTCNDTSCSKIVNDTTETIDYKTGILTVSNVEYTYMINHNNITYQDNSKELVCTYTSGNYGFYSKIDTSFTTNTNCEVYINTINKTINKYQDLFASEGIDVNQLKK